MRAELGLASWAVLDLNQYRGQAGGLDGHADTVGGLAQPVAAWDAAGAEAVPDGAADEQEHRAGQADPGQHQASSRAAMCRCRPAQGEVQGRIAHLGNDGPSQPY